MDDNGSEWSLLGDNEQANREADQQTYNIETIKEMNGHDIVVEGKLALKADIPFEVSLRDPNRSEDRHVVSVSYREGKIIWLTNNKSSKGSYRMPNDKVDECLVHLYANYCFDGEKKRK